MCALTAPISIANEKTVTATLGEENIEKGVQALVIGMAALFLFMIVYYQQFGVVADLVLLANVIVLAALLSMFRTVLSLPGIAGIILTVGMAVDANVLNYERIREELRNGVSPQAAIRAGFDKAFSAIADSNVTTFIARRGAVRVRHRRDQGLCHRAVARHSHVDVHRAHGLARTADADVRRQAQLTKLAIG